MANDIEAADGPCLDLPEAIDAALAKFGNALNAANLKLVGGASPTDLVVGGEAGALLSATRDVRLAIRAALAAPATVDAGAMREALLGWARFCMKWPAKECDDGSGYYSEADHDQAACYAETLRVLAPPLPAPASGAVEEALIELRAAIKARRDAWHANDAAAHRTAGANVERATTRIVVAIDRDTAAAERADRGGKGA